MVAEVGAVRRLGPLAGVVGSVGSVASVASVGSSTGTLAVLSSRSRRSLLSYEGEGAASGYRARGDGAPVLLDVALPGLAAPGYLAVAARRRRRRPVLRVVSR